LFLFFFSSNLLHACSCGFDSPLLIHQTYSPLIFFPFAVGLKIKTEKIEKSKKLTEFFKN
ncbi:hypothetical protein OFM39_33905, partial [Escherichia coli]|nr:hypothetical protein [Escherichia coli]